MDGFGAKRVHPAAIGNRRAIAAVERYFPLMTGWNTRAAFATAKLRSMRGDLRPTKRELEALKSEVATAFEQFKAETAEVPRHSRVQDVEAAFRRLLHNLYAVSVSSD